MNLFFCRWRAPCVFSNQTSIESTKDQIQDELIKLLTNDTSKARFKDCDLFTVFWLQADISDDHSTNLNSKIISSRRIQHCCKGEEPLNSYTKSLARHSTTLPFDRRLLSCSKIETELFVAPYTFLQFV